MVMKVLVPVKRVLDYNIKARVKSDHSGIDLGNVKMSMNPFDEIAVEEAVKLKEAGKISEIILFTAGPKKAIETLRAGLAIGADRGIHYITDQDLEPLAVAKLLQKTIENESPELVIMGKQAIDNDCNQTGQMLAALQDWPQATFASQVELSDKAATVTREIDGGLETIEVQLPAIITTDLRLNVPRYAALPNIMKAKKKPVEEIQEADFGIDISNKIETLKVEEPAARTSGIMVKTLDELMDKLKNEAQVI